MRNGDAPPSTDAPTSVATQPIDGCCYPQGKPADTPYRLFDGGGLYLEIPATGNKRWRFKYRFGGKEKLLALGTYPDVSLVGAVQSLDGARAIIARQGMIAP